MCALRRLLNNVHATKFDHSFSSCSIIRENKKQKSEKGDTKQKQKSLYLVHLFLTRKSISKNIRIRKQRRLTFSPHALHKNPSGNFEQIFTTKSSKDLKPNICLTASLGPNLSPFKIKVELRLVFLQLRR